MIKAMVEFGITPMQVIVSGTKDAARACGLGRDLGTLAPGKIADVIVVDGDPLQDIDAFSRVRIVIREGVVIRQDDF